MQYRHNIPSLLILVLLATPLEVVGQQEHHSHADDAEEVEEIIVQATRSRRRIQDEAIRVEVLSREEIEEKLLMRPGNISMMLNETGGLRVQVASPAIGSANVRIYGMRGRYTQLLADGLPLYGGQASSLGLLQVPPSDLGQVEIIKGSASALYGGQSLGGVVNLVSKRPGADTAGEVILNATTRDAQDLSAYVENALNNAWSGSILANFNRQSEQDLDDDGWIDMPGYERFSARPRLYYQGDDDFSAYLTVGAMSEDRRGGTVAGGVVPGGEAFQQNQDTRRYDAGLVIENSVGSWGVAQLRASGMRQSHDHRFGGLFETDEHETTSWQPAFGGMITANTAIKSVHGCRCCIGPARGRSAVRGGAVSMRRHPLSKKPRRPGYHDSIRYPALRSKPPRLSRSTLVTRPVLSKRV